MKENYIVTAKWINKREGDCTSVICKNCPAYFERLKEDFFSCRDLWQSNEVKRKLWFENWLKENEDVKEMEKTQMTEEQAIKLYDDCIAESVVTQKSAFIIMMKDKGYIKKSELQQMVENVEETNYKYFNTKGVSLSHRDIIKIYYDAIQALKKDHPEFKKVNEKEYNLKEIIRQADISKLVIFGTVPLASADYMEMDTKDMKNIIRGYEALRKLHPEFKL